LLDLDLTGPSDHVVLGCDPGFPDEEFGIDPVPVGGVGFMSVTCFSGRTPAPLRGVDVTNALLELLAITRWGKRDILVIDMPPGLGDVTLDLVRLLGRAEYLVVANRSPLVLETVRKTLRLHTELGTRIAGVVENMASAQASPAVRELAAEHDVRWLGALPFDHTIDAALGDPSRLTRTPFASALAQGISGVLSAG
jgi:ATP-binding protein involved in chromosome partitioning